MGLVQLGPVAIWKQILRKNFVNPSILADFLELDEMQRKQLLLNPRFVLNLPYRLAQKIKKGTLNDPILKQFLPTVEETNVAFDFVDDPVGDTKCRIGSKLLHKYEGRILLVCTSACAMHCRYCFRQHFDYETTSKGFEEEIRIIKEDSSIHEVILSGGDPLSLDDRVLRQLFESLAAIPHIKRVRFHTRFPIGIPERIDASFLSLLESFPFQFWFVIHTNHPQELDEEVLKALKEVQKRGVPVLNQFVLLKGVNDEIAILKELCEKLADHGIYSYYMHQLDRVQGAAHFEVSEERGKELVQELAKNLPGYAVPRYVREISGMPSKTPL
jgi:EF-P beta-lysylation protein EpmB